MDIHNHKEERIAKVIARAGVCSRRQAEDWIIQGRVCVNGQVLSSPACVVGEKDIITVDGMSLAATPPPPRVFLYHKPAGLLTTHADEHGRATVFDSLPPGLPRLISVGRLDKNTQGLLLLTNDGSLARALELPSAGWARVYRVRVHGVAHAHMLAPLTKGMTVDGIRYRPIEASIERHQGTNTWLILTLYEGKNREIRRLMEHLGLPVTRLIRVAFGPFTLGDLNQGAVREVESWEIAALKVNKG